jgi:hypothetical protein
LSSALMTPVSWLKFPPGLPPPPNAGSLGHGGRPQGNDDRQTQSEEGNPAHGTLLVSA